MSNLDDYEQMVEHFRWSAGGKSSMDLKVIDRYEAGGKKLARAVEGLTEQDLRWKPTDSSVGSWSIHQIVIHLLDSELAGGDRIRRLIAQDNPLLVAWDENQYMQRLFYDDQPVSDAIAMIDLYRRNVTRILRKLPLEAFARTGIHTERGKLSLEEQVRITAAHVEHHLKFILAKRQKLGKPLKD